MLQKESLHFEEQVYISLPKSFNINIADEKLLIENNIKIIQVPDNLSIGLSIFYSLNKIKERDEPIRILYGDTLITNLPLFSNFYALGKPEYNYEWASINNNEVSNLTYSGYFSFENIYQLIDSLYACDFDFIKSIKHYKSLCNVKEEICNNWFDLGHINSYYRSKSKLTTERAFNAITIEERVLTKTGDNHQKIEAEAFWFEQLPNEIKVFAPVYLGRNSNNNSQISYKLEYLFLSSLNELFIFGTQPEFVWEIIFNKLTLFLEKAASIKPNNNLDLLHNSIDLYLGKTTERLHKLKDQTGIDINSTWIFNEIEVPSLIAIAQETSKSISTATEKNIGLLHGDFCFSNILFDFKSIDIKLIDPRGLTTSNEFSIYGDTRYDIAKLSHSIIGCYDHIIAGYYSLEYHQENKINFQLHTSNIHKTIQQKFLDTQIGQYSVSSSENYAIMIHLFLSMLPLHYENKKKQLALLSNALRLYLIYKKMFN
ncbi:MAG TPA: hypothetical protein PLU36_04885 [Chitinophagaceae bacterium]|nr:aminoglycoside phosphotransferase family protein [Chitinophagaceae bacterium]HMZ46117.1 hypothetical protein [Chitinophagaceae bacterium]